MMKLNLNVEKLIFSFFVFVLIFMNSSFVFANLEETNSNSETKILTRDETQRILSKETKMPSLESKAGILMDSKTGNVLYGKREEEKMYPASTTKILTAILTLENCNLNDVATVSYEAISSIPEGYSVADLQVGEHISIEHLLEALLLYSANDAANVLAEHVGGSIESFVSMMNTKVHELGLSHTHFTNAFGLHEETHYSTAHDLATIMQYCMKNENFRKLCGEASCAIPATDKYEPRSYTSTNKLILLDDEYYYPYNTCGKTGFTSQAGYCLVSCSYKDNLELICVIFGGDTLKNPATRFRESKELFEYGYQNYSVKTIVAQNEVVTNLEVKNGTQDTKNLELLASTSFSILVKNSISENDIPIILNLNDSIKAPIGQGKVLGSATYTIEGKEYTIDLVASHSVEPSMFFLIFIGIGILSLILILLIIYWVFFYRGKKDEI